MPFVPYSRLRIITVIATALAVLGLIMTVATDATYTSSAFRWTFALMPRRAWGVLFLIAGALTATDHVKPVGRFAGAVLTLLCAVYAFTLLFAVWTGDATSGTGWIWPGAIAGTLALLRPHRAKVDPG